MKVRIIIDAEIDTNKLSEAQADDTVVRPSPMRVALFFSRVLRGQDWVEWRNMSVKAVNFRQKRR